MPRIFFIFLFTYFLLAGPYVAAQSPVEEEYINENIELYHFDDSQYAKLTKDVDFSEEVKKEKPKKKRKKREIKFEGIGPALRFLFISLGISVLIFILIKTLGNENIFSPENKKIKPVVEIDLEKIEENLEETELDDPIRQAIAAENYPLAVRLYYLAILKGFALKKMIKWKKDKTNGEYLRELAGTPLFEDMQKATMIFERIWYGKMELRKEEFAVVEKIFLKLMADNK